MKRTRFGWLEFFIGVFMIALGIFTFLRPTSVLEGFTIGYGIMGIISGIRDIIFYCRAGRYTGFTPVLSLTASIVSLMAGIMLVVYPNAGVWIISLVIPIWFISHSIFQLASLERLRFLISGFHFCFSLIASIIGLILGISMLFSPVTSLLAVSTIIGVYLLITGITSVVVAFSETGYRS